MLCQVKLVKGEFTVNEDWWTNMDPFVEIKQGSKILLKTPVQDGAGKNVNFKNQTFTYKIGNLNESVSITATDQDPIWDDLIGNTTVSAEKLCPLGTKTHKIGVKKDGEHRGYLTFTTTRQ